MVNVSTLANSGSVYEQLISQVIAVESQPRLQLRAEQTEQGVYKGVLSDFSSRVSTLNTLLEKLQDPLRSPFSARAADVPEGAGFTASATDAASPGTHEIQVTQLARADARLSKQLASSGDDFASLFVDPGEPEDPGDPGGPFGVPPPRPPRPATPDAYGERSFTLSVAQPEGDAVDLTVAYTPTEGDTNDEVLAGLASAITAASEAAVADGRLAEGTGASASVVRETDDTARLSLRSAATGYGNRLEVADDPDGILAALEVDTTAERVGTGGGAVYAVGTGPQDSALNAAFVLDGLEIYRDSNTVDDALDGVTFTLASVADEASTLTIGADTASMRSEVDAFVTAYNGLVTFLNDKSRVDGDTGERGALANDAAARALRAGVRTDLSREVAGDFARLADLGIETQRDGTIKITDASLLDDALSASPQAVGALFSGDDGLGARLTSRFEGLLGSSGTIAQRREGADARIDRLDAQIERWDTRLTRREDSLRAQFAQLEAIVSQAQSQQASLNSLFFF